MLPEKSFCVQNIPLILTFKGRSEVEQSMIMNNIFSRQYFLKLQRAINKYH